MESYEMMVRRRVREAAKRAKIAKLKTIANEILGSVVFVGLLFGFYWFCYVAGGYR